MCVASNTGKGDWQAPGQTSPGQQLANAFNKRKNPDGTMAGVIRPGALAGTQTATQAMRPASSTRTLGGGVGSTVLGG